MQPRRYPGTAALALELYRRSTLDLGLVPNALGGLGVLDLATFVAAPFCCTLLGEFGATPAAKDLRGIKEDLGRWVTTEGQGNWQKDYNTTKARIEKSFLGEQRFGEAIREWSRFEETSADPLLHSRIQQEVRAINQLAVAAADKLVQEAAGDRTKLEEAQPKFSGTEGQAVLTKAIKGIK